MSTYRSRIYITYINRDLNYMIEMRLQASNFYLAYELAKNRIDSIVKLDDQIEGVEILSIELV